ncbi:MAG: phospholipase D family protein [Burkholderiaceae bacterium]|nr:phospholipase D family protein [Burkholderiaceae bacterium]
MSMRARRGRRWWILLAVLAPLAGFLTMVGCASLPSLEGRTPSTALDAEQAQATRLGVATRPLVAAHPGTSGLLPLTDARAAFAARALLARHAERTIDVQYYIWQDDVTGTLLLTELERAAGRGVRVRLLLDDNGIRGIDDALVALAAQPNFEVRLFNPFTFRHPKWVNYLTAFPRLNHRMHNKSFTVDNAVTIIGGRNVGDTYFGATDEVAFVDLDVLAIGPVVPEVSHEFDRYWASRSAYPVERIVGKPAHDALTHLHARETRIGDDPAARIYRQALAENHAVQALLDYSAELTWAPTRTIGDSPAKALRAQGDGERLIDELAPVFADTRVSLQLVSPYLVLGDKGTRDVAAMARRGVDVQVLTNSLAATDVAAVHAGYAKRRKQLLAAGVRLYELRPTGHRLDDRDLAGPFGSSGSSLHAKTFAVDDRTLFIGSFNFDPRSANLNTEMGFLVDSPALAQTMHEAFAHEVPARAYEVRLDADGKLYWLLRQGDAVQRFDTEPDTSWLRRMSVRLLALLPIDWLL